MSETTEVQLKEYRSQLNEWEAKINEMKLQAEKKETSARIEFHKHIDETERKFLALQEKISEMEGTSGDAREKLRKGVEEAYKDLDKSISKAIKGVTR